MKTETKIILDAVVEVLRKEVNRLRGEIKSSHAELKGEIETIANAHPNGLYKSVLLAKVENLESAIHRYAQTGSIYRSNLVKGRTPPLIIKDLVNVQNS